MLSSDNAQAIVTTLSDHFAAAPSGDLAKGESFITPFFTAESWGVINFTGGALEGAGFTAVLDGNDFYRENKDGTVSVHVNSNTAQAEYFENLFDPEALVLIGSPAHLSVNLTGPVIEIPLPNGEVIRFIDLNSPKTRALSVHGNGKVYDAEGGQYKLLVALTETPSGNRRSTFTLK